MASPQRRSRIPGASTPGSHARQASGSSAGAPAGAESVVVCVRMRPLNRLETRTRQQVAWELAGNVVRQTFVPEDRPSYRQGAKGRGRKPMAFPFDHVLGPEDTNEVLYERVASGVVGSCMRGYHGCVFAYGQTSSGKTHTIHGTAKSPGVIPLAVEQVFDTIEEAVDREYVLRVSFIEIYNEVINDLLNPSSSTLRIREDRRRGVFVEGLKEDVVMSADQVFSLLHAGTSQRSVGRTNYNDFSSRSHTIFRITVESSARGDKSAAVRYSTLNLVDLAGSENAVKAGSAARVAETGYINKSLLTLGHVIFKLSEQSREHIPYRDSKLTRILTQSLSGKARVAVVCNISPSSGNLEETASTLKFANRAKKVRSQAQLNEKTDESALLVKYRREIDRLRSELTVARTHTAQLVEEEFEEAKQREEAQRRLEETEQEKAELKGKIEQLQRLIVSSSRPQASAAAGGGADGGADAAGGGGTGGGTGGRGGAPGRRRRGSIARGPPRFGMKRQDAGSTLFATLPRGFVMPKDMSALTHVPHSESSVADLDQELAGGGEGENDLLCDAPGGPAAGPGEPSIDPSADDSVQSLRVKLVRMKMLLDGARSELHESRERAGALEAELEEKNALLQQWDDYFVSNSNKQAAIKTELRRVAAKGDGATVAEVFDTLELADADFDAPLVDLDDADGDDGAEGSGAGHQRTDTKRFDEVMARFRSMEQDGDL